MSHPTLTEEKHYLSPPESPIIESDQVHVDQVHELDVISVSAVTDLEPDNDDTAMLDLILDPADVLTDRARGWKDLVGTLKHHFARLAEAEKAQTKTLADNQKEWAKPAPLREHAFGEQSGITNLATVFKQDTTTEVAQHRALHESLEHQTVPALEAMFQSLKRKLAVLDREQRERNKERSKDKSNLMKAQHVLAMSLSYAQRPGTDALQHGDPWIANFAVKKQLAAAKIRNTIRNEALENIKSDFKVFEANLIRELKVILLGVTSLSEIIAQSADHLAGIENMLDGFDAEVEWDAFCVEQLDKSGGLAMFETDEYPGHDDPLIGVIYEGSMSRKSKGLFASFTEYFYIVTAAGYLHEFTSKPQMHRIDKLVPKKTIFLGDCSLGPLGMQDRNPGEFIMTEKREFAKMFKRASRLHKFLGSSLTDSHQFYSAVSTVCKVTFGVIAYGSTNLLAWHGVPTTGSIRADSIRASVTRAQSVSIAGSVRSMRASSVRQPVPISVPRLRVPSTSIKVPATKPVVRSARRPASSTTLTNKSEDKSLLYAFDKPLPDPALAPVKNYDVKEPLFFPAVEFVNEKSAAFSQGISAPNQIVA
ncbi:hypothetical protein HDU98_002321 [Podochytrium sp. JEL0797]|nr:hypothetical protein HDU98_002321 [Podochytrium sp. JEL0797]